MARQNWTVKLFEARSAQEFVRTQIAADAVESFGVMADGSDMAKVEAKKWLGLRGYLTFRSVAVSATDKNTLIIYVPAGATVQAKATVAALNARKK